MDISPELEKKKGEKEKNEKIYMNVQFLTGACTGNVHAVDNVVLGDHCN